VTANPKDTALGGLDWPVTHILHDLSVVDGLELVDLSLLEDFLCSLTEITAIFFPPPQDVLVGGIGVF